MATGITPEKLNNIWRSGFCRAMVEHARTTKSTLQGSEERVKWLRNHLLGCQDCTFANILKNEEATVAEEIGPQALGAFARGEDVTKRPGYSPTLVKKAMDRLAKRGLVTVEFVEWIHRAAKRKRYKR